MLSLNQIKHDKFYIDCGDNATLRECVKLLPYGKNWVQISALLDGGGIGFQNKVIAIENNSTYYTINEPHAIEPTIYHYSQISEFAHLHSNWYGNVHIMD